MAFRAGRYTEITVSGVPLSGYVDSIDVSRDVEMLETTTFTNAAKTFIPGLSDAKVDIKGKYDPTVVTGLTGGPAALMTQITGAQNAVNVRIWPGGNATGQTDRNMTAYVSSYKEASEVGGIVTFEASFQVTGAIVASGI